MEDEGGFASLASPAAFLDLPAPRVHMPTNMLRHSSEVWGTARAQKKKAAGEMIDDLQKLSKRHVLPAGGVSVSSSAPIDTNITAASHARRTKLLERLETISGKTMDEAGFLIGSWAETSAAFSLGH